MDLNLTELDDLLEKRFGTVVEADDNLNDETFGDDVPMTDFDFGSASTNEPPKIPFEKPTAAFPEPTRPVRPTPQTLEEIENQMRWQARSGSPPRMGNQSPPQPSKIINVADFEAEMIARHRQQIIIQQASMQSHPSPMLPPGMIPTHEQMYQQQQLQHRFQQMQLQQQQLQQQQLQQERLIHEIQQQERLAQQQRLEQEKRQEQEKRIQRPESPPKAQEEPYQRDAQFELEFPAPSASVQRKVPSERPKEGHRQNQEGHRHHKGQVIMSTSRQGHQSFQQNNPDEPSRSNNYDNRRRKDQNRRPYEFKIRPGYDGIMTQHEKELIARIQISQLVSDDPMKDDFYYQMYKNINQPKDSDPAEQEGKWQQSLVKHKDAEASLHVTEKMERQMRRLVENRRTRAKGTSLTLEGALGKVSFQSSKNPKQAIQIERIGEHKHEDLVAMGPLSQSAVLRLIEKLYKSVLLVEHLSSELYVVEDDQKEQHELDIQQNIHTLIDDLHIRTNVLVAATHPLIYIVNFRKGCRVLPRITRYFNREHIFLTAKTLFSGLQGLEVCHVPIGSQNEQVDIFMKNVFPPLVRYISQSSFNVINPCMRIVLDRDNVLWLTKSRVSLAILTMLLSRSEILKQGGWSTQGLPPPTEAELSTWTDLYNYLFACLYNHFAEPFDHVMEVENDEVYVWQFLSAMAVSASSIEHQKVLVAELREKVIETSKKTDNTKAVANVNLFLNALGLGIDANQLAAAVVS